MMEESCFKHNTNLSKVQTIVHFKYQFVVFLANMIVNFTCDIGQESALFSIPMH